MATGAGKTLLALAAVRRLAAKCAASELKTKIVVPTVFLANQWQEEIRRELGAPRQDIGIYCGARKDWPPRPYMIYVINTARRCLARHILDDTAAGRAVFLICDECHHYGSRENARIFEFLPFVPRERYFALGLSATPECERFTETVVPALGREIYRFGINEATVARITARYDLFHVGVDFSADESEDYDSLCQLIIRMTGRLLRKERSLRGSGSEQFFRRLRLLSHGRGPVAQSARSLLLLYYRRKKLLHLAAARLSCATELVRRLIDDRRIIVFCPYIESADKLYRTLSQAFPGRICRYHSRMDTAVRRRELERYRTGEVRVIVCCRALDEGLNVPETDVGIIVSLDSSQRQQIQRIGRVIRRGPGDRIKSLYHIHVRETAEQVDLIPDALPDIHVYYLQFDEAEGSLLSGEYSALAESVRRELAAAGAGRAQLARLDAMLDRGAVRADYLLPLPVCDALLKAAGPAERDYRIAMRRLAAAHARGLCDRAHISLS